MPPRTSSKRRSKPASFRVGRVKAYRRGRVWYLCYHEHRRKGGAKMVTYRGRPLYFYQHDSPGVVLCHDVTSFGGDWFVVKRNGRRA